MDTFFEKLIGARLHIKTALGEDVEGTVFAVDKATGTLVMKQEGLYGACTLRIIPMDQQLIKIDEGNGFKLASGPVEPLPKVDLARAKAREEDAVKKVNDALHKIGVGVSREAQNIFEALDKTLPCRWEGKDILVLDEVRIREPYDAGACQVLVDQAHAQSVLERVKLVLQHELQRLAL